MLSAAIENAINEQINNEFCASYLYLSMSAYCERKNFSGFAAWLRLQSQEETTHGMKLFDFVRDCDGKIVLREIAAPQSDFDSILSLFEKVLEHEIKVTQCINQLFELAHNEKAFVVQAHLQWFLLEQIEEENTSRDIVEKLRLIGNDVASLLALDRELGTLDTGK